MKWKNYGLWVSFASLLFMVLKDMGYQIDLTQWQTYITAILSILVALGIISNPENGKGYFNAKVPPTTTGGNDIDQTNNLNEHLTNESDLNSEETNPTQTQNSSENQDPEKVVHDRKYTPYEK